MVDEIKEANGILTLDIGDIIWAKRYKTEEEMRKLKKGHKESPYVIIKKTKTKVVALQCTSNPHNEITWKIPYYPLGRLNYEMHKNSYINCLKVYELNENQYVKTIGKLSSYDLNQLKKHLYILINSGFKTKPKIEKKYLNYKISIGDIIIINNNKYYINNIKKSEYEVYRIKKHIKKCNNILINNTYYSFIFENKERISKKSNYTLIDTFNTGEIEIINQYKIEQLKEKNKKSSSINIGSIVIYNGNMYYVYNIDKDIYNVYQIYSSNISKLGMGDILVKGGVYRTFFATSILKKINLEKNGYSIRRNASKEEIEYNNKIFNLPKEDRIKARKKLTSRLLITDDINALVPMSIVKNENNNKYYLIIDKKDNIIEVVNINDLKDTFYFELEQDNCPFKYYRILSKEDYDRYIMKINELKETLLKFNI